MNKLITIEPEYVYVTIPAEYICVYHRILAMMTDYGEEMLKDCKASCTNKNSDVIECFNMFNSAVAARKLGKNKLAETLIKYIKTKINHIYKGIDNSTSFVFPIDENGEIKAFVSCGELPKFEINPDDGMLYEHKFNNGFDEHFHLGPEDESPDGEEPEPPIQEVGLVVEFTPFYEKNEDDTYSPCGELIIRYNGEPVNVNTVSKDYYFDDTEISNWNDIILSENDFKVHNFKVVVIYNEETKMININKSVTHLYPIFTGFNSSTEFTENVIKSLTKLGSYSSLDTITDTKTNDSTSNYYWIITPYKINNIVVSGINIVSDFICTIEQYRGVTYYCYRLNTPSSTDTFTFIIS